MNYRVYCLPYAGGGVAHYHRWRRRAPGHMEFVPLCPSGRESRFNERLMTSFDEIVDDLMTVIQSHEPLPYAILGHSMGALVGYELARRLDAQGKPPHLLLSAACRAPHFGPCKPPLHRLSDDDLVQELRRRYGDQGDVFSRPEARKIFLPIIRADLEAIETHQPKSLSTLPCPIIAIGAEQDGTISPEHLQAWNDYTTASLEIVMRPGNHFFVQSDADWFIETIEQFMCQSLSVDV